MSLRPTAIRLPRTPWQWLTRRSVWLHTGGGFTLRGFPAGAVIRWYNRNVEPGSDELKED